MTDATITYLADTLAPVFNGVGAYLTIVGVGKLAALVATGYHQVMDAVDGGRDCDCCDTTDAVSERTIGFADIEEDDD